VVREEACDPFASDVWSLAVCVYAMLTGRPLYNSVDDQAFRIMASPPLPTTTTTTTDKDASPDDQVVKMMMMDLSTSSSPSSEWGAKRVIEAYEAHGLVLPPLTKDLLCHMLHPIPSQRPTLEEILLHPFFYGTTTTTNPLAEEGALLLLPNGTIITPHKGHHPTTGPLSPTTITTMTPTTTSTITTMGSLLPQVVIGG